jgi:GNAT superfamily N-acetyltransferase
MIRLARSADLPLLGPVEESAAQRFVGTPMAFVAGSAPSPADALAAALAANCLWVAVDDQDVPQGFLFGEVVDGWFHILELSVAADAQGCGHGSALLAAVAAAAPGLGCDRLSLTTDRDIVFNGPWYRRRGFFEITSDMAPDWLAAIPAREAADGLDPARRAIMARGL